MHCSWFTELYDIGLYREIAIAIQKEAGDSNGVNVYYVTMRITFNIPEFTRNERNSHCDVLHIAPVRVANLVLVLYLIYNYVQYIRLYLFFIFT